jgi:hypothetical protein
MPRSLSGCKMDTTPLAIDGPLVIFIKAKPGVFSDCKVTGARIYPVGVIASSSLFSKRILE